MRCPYCLDSLTAVVDARWDSRHQTIRRHRKCPECQYHWTTLEIDYDQVRHLDSISRSRSKGSSFPQERRQDNQGRYIAPEDNSQHRGSEEPSDVDDQIDNKDNQDDLDDHLQTPFSSF